MVSNRNLLFQGCIFRCHVSFREGIYEDSIPSLKLTVSLPLKMEAVGRWSFPFGSNGLFSVFFQGTCDMSIFLGGNVLIPKSWRWMDQMIFLFNQVIFRWTMLIFLGCKNHGISKRFGHSSHEFSRNKLEFFKFYPFSWLHWVNMSVNISMGLWISLRPYNLQVQPSNDFASWPPPMIFHWLPCVFEDYVVQERSSFKKKIHYPWLQIAHPISQASFKKNIAFIACIPSSDYSHSLLASRKGCCFSVNCFWSSWETKIEGGVMHVIS